MVCNCTTSCQVQTPLSRGLRVGEGARLKGCPVFLAVPGEDCCPGAPPPDPAWRCCCCCAAAPSAGRRLLLCTAAAAAAAAAHRALYFVQHIFLCCCCCRPRALPRAFAHRQIPSCGRKMGAWGEDRGGGGAAGQMCSDKFQLLAGRGCVHTWCASAFFGVVTSRDCQHPHPPTPPASCLAKQ